MSGPWNPQERARAVLVTASLVGMMACTDPSAASAPTDTGAAQAPCTEGLVEGECAPDFMLPEASGVEVALSDHAGSIVLVASEALW